MLVLCDIEAIKGLAQANKQEKATADLDAWQVQLSEQLEAARGALEARAPKWELVGEVEKAGLFRQTAAAVAALLDDLVVLTRELGGSNDERRRVLQGVNERWTQLELRTRSLLAWDIEGALGARRAREMEAMYAMAERRLKEVKKLMADSLGKLSDKKKKNYQDRLTNLEKQQKAIEKSLDKDPQMKDPENKAKLFNLVIESTELYRRIIQE